MIVKIIDTKVVASCNMHRELDEEISKDRYGRIYDDTELCCVTCEVKGDLRYKSITKEIKRLENANLLMALTGLAYTEFTRNNEEEIKKLKLEIEK